MLMMTWNASSHGDNGQGSLARIAGSKWTKFPSLVVSAEISQLLDVHLARLIINSASPCPINRTIIIAFLNHLREK